MKFWAIAYQYQEDVFVDFEKQDDTMNFNNSCFLPTKELAEQFIEDQLSDDYVPVEIELISYRDGVLCTSRIGRVDHWDEAYE